MGDADIDTLIDYEHAESVAKQYPLHDRDPALHKACFRGQIAQVTELLAHGSSEPNLNARNYHYCTPLHLAICADHGAIVRILLAAGADPSLKYDIEPCYMISYAALDLAAWLGKRDALFAIIDHGIETTVTALHLSASLNHVACLKVMLEKLGESDFPDSSRQDGIKTALESAALCWHVEAFKMLFNYWQDDYNNNRFLGKKEETLGQILIPAFVEYDCDDRCRLPTFSFRDGDAIPQRLLAIVQLLTKAGADVNAHQPEDSQQTPFWCCLHMPTVPRQIVHLLLDNGLRVNASHTESSPLFGIIGDENDDPSLLETFIAAGASVKVKDEDDNTLLHRTTHVSFAKVLITHGADVHARNIRGETPFHRACDQGNIPLVNLLLTCDVDVNDVSTVDQWTPLLFAAGVSDFHHTDTPDARLQLVQLLHHLGAHLHPTAPNGLTSLHRAVQAGNTALVRYLVDHGTDVRAATTSGFTSLHYASTNTKSGCEMYVLPIIAMLLDHGADISARDTSGNVPILLSVAACRQLWWFSPAVCNFLLEKGADRDVADRESKTVRDIVAESEEWAFDSDGYVRHRPRPVHIPPTASGRDRDPDGTRYLW